MEAAWPDGVVARYLTVGGATVDLAVVSRPHQHPDGVTGERNATRAACTGCPAVTEFSHWGLKRGLHAQWEIRDPQTADKNARNWAQGHAEACRAMPRPA